MITFIIGLLILIIGGYAYGAFCQKIFGPDDRITPAYRLEDGVDFVPMKSWKNSLINLLNIAGTGPILGPIQGILFGPIAFITIPIGCVIGGAMHDYFSGMLSMRNNGAQMPTLVNKYTNSKIHKIYLVFSALLLLLVGVVFVYTPGDIAATQIFGFDGAASSISTWIIYLVIFIYYIAATVFPIDAIIGRIYPVFGAILLFSSVGVFLGLFFNGYQLTNLSLENWKGVHPNGVPFIPTFFLTVACGIVSGFHSTQTALIGRSVTHEKQGRNTFYNMMILEGFIAMVWAAATMGAFAKGIGDASTPPTAMIGIISKDMLGNIGGFVAILGVIVLPITSGDTALRGLRLMIAEQFNIDQKTIGKRMGISIILFAIVAAILIWAKLSPGGFNILWRYFAWTNQTLAIFAFAIITIYLLGKGKKTVFLMSLLPGMFYTFIISSFILNASIGFNLPNSIAKIAGVVLTCLYATYIYTKGVSINKSKLPLEVEPVYPKN